MIFCTRFSKQWIFSKAKNLKFGKRNRAKICAFTAKFKSVILHENPNKKWALIFLRAKIQTSPFYAKIPINWIFYTSWSCKILRNFCRYDLIEMTSWIVTMLFGASLLLMLFPPHWLHMMLGGGKLVSNWKWSNKTMVSDT